MKLPGAKFEIKEKNNYNSKTKLRFVTKIHCINILYCSMIVVIL